MSGFSGAYQVEEKKCSANNCDSSFTDHYWGNIESHRKGWFKQMNGDVWCPDHVPEWVQGWRTDTASSEASASPPASKR